MEFYDSSKDDDTTLPGGKKKKKPDNSWRNYNSESDNSTREDQARKHILELFAKADESQNKEETPDLFGLKTSDEQEQSAGAPDAESHDTDTPIDTWTENQPPQNIQENQTFEENVVRPDFAPEQSAAIQNDDLFNKPPESQSFWEQTNQQAPEPVRPVSGYSSDGEYFRGYVPGTNESEPDLATQTSGGSSGGNLPPTPPNQPGGESADRQPYGYEPAALIAQRHNQVNHTEADQIESENRGLRHGIVAGFLTGYILKSYLAGRKRKREQKEFSQEIKQHQKSFQELQAESIQRQQHESEQQKHIDRLEDEQKKLEQRFAEKLKAQTEAQQTPTVFKPESTPAINKPESVSASKVEEESALSPDKKAESDKLAMIEAARRALDEAAEPEPKARVEQDAWLRHELDEHGHEIQGQSRGQEYTHERAQELMQHQPQAQDYSRKAGAQPVIVGQQHGQYAQDQSQDTTQTLASGQVPADHQLPYTTQHPYTGRKKHSSAVAALTSPWTFLMLSLILLAYFIATLL